MSAIWGPKRAGRTVSQISRPFWLLNMSSRTSEVEREDRDGASEDLSRHEQEVRLVGNLPQ